MYCINNNISILYYAKRKKGGILMNNLEKYRREANMSQRELSEISGVSRNTISLIETGAQTNVTRVVMDCLSEALNKPVEAIFF